MGNQPSSSDRFGTVDRRSISLTANPFTSLTIFILVLGTVLSIVYCLYKKRESLDKNLWTVDSSQYNSRRHPEKPRQDRLLSHERISDIV